LKSMASELQECKGPGGYQRRSTASMPKLATLGTATKEKEATNQVIRAKHLTVRHRGNHGPYPEGVPAVALARVLDAHHLPSSGGAERRAAFDRHEVRGPVGAGERPTGRGLGLAADPLEGAR